MGMDVDFVFAKEYIDRLKRILFRLEDGNCSEFADDIIEFVKKMEKKYGQNQ